MIKCQNLDCPSRVVNSIIYFASKNCLNIDGLGDKIVELLVNEKKPIMLPVNNCMNKFGS